MKKTFAFTILLALVLIANSAFAQENFDKITMLNGEEHVGKVTAMDDQNIKFVHKDESLEYSYKKAEINKIQFSSGRIEVLNQVADDEDGSSGGNLQDYHNLIAVLPFTYLTREGGHDEQMEKKVQSDCYNTLNKFARQFNLQDPVTTNATLIKNGISSDNIAGFTPAELCHILNVEYVVMGTVTVMYTSTTNSSYGSSQSQKDKKNRNVTFSSGSSTAVDNFKTTVDLKVYTTDGQNIFAQSHESFWQTEDAYLVTLQYLVKHSPLYQK